MSGLQNIVLGNGQVTIQFVVDPLGIVKKESVVSQELSDSSHFCHLFHKAEGDLILRFLDLLGWNLFLLNPLQLLVYGR